MNSLVLTCTVTFLYQKTKTCMPMTSIRKSNNIIFRKSRKLFISILLNLFSLLLYRTIMQFERVDIKVEKSEENKSAINLVDNIDKPKIHIAENGKKYASCEICTRNVAVNSWRRHARLHRGEKRYSCHTCGLAFNDSGNLTRHTRALHAGNRPHSCSLCRKTFSRNSHLQDHVKSHSDNREFVCDLCGKASKSSTALRMHKKTHENRRNYLCMECGSRFKRPGELRAHVTVHTGEKAFNCKCGRTFRLQSQLTAHSRTHKNTEACS